MGNRLLLSTVIEGSKSGQTHRHTEIGWFQIPVSEVPSDKEGFEVFCKRGCNNYNHNGGCPPFAPSFDRLRKIYANMVVFYVRFGVAEFPVTLIEKNQAFFCAQYAQAVLPPVIGYIRKEGKKLWNPDMVLGESACKTCKECAFSQKAREYYAKELSENYRPTCKNPKERMYSLESSGVDVDLLMRWGAFPLYWFESGHSVLETPYTIKAVGFLYKGSIPKVDWSQDLLDLLNKRKGWSAKKFLDFL